MPQIEVTFDIDANGMLTVSAKDLDTGKEQSITIDDSGRMSDDEIERAIRDAEQYAAQDQVRRNSLSARDEAAKLLAEVDRALASKAAKQVDKDERKQVKAAADNLRRLLSQSQQAARPHGFGKKAREAAAANPIDDAPALHGATETLRTTSAHLREVTGE